MEEQIKKLLEEWARTSETNLSRSYQIDDDMVQLHVEARNLHKNGFVYTLKHTMTLILPTTEDSIRLGIKLLEDELINYVSQNQFI